MRWALRSRQAAEATVRFVCNVCDVANEVPRAAIRREVPSCSACGSTLRWRAMIGALSLGLFGCPATVRAFTDAPALVGLGTSDWEGYAARLAAACSYRNTYYDREPRLDLTEPVPPALRRSCDFVLSSDVLEHVPPPYERALVHLRELLVPGGLLVLSVPTLPSGPVVEHFPELDDYSIATRDGRPVLVNRTADGRQQVFDDLRFHGGEGATLEMRVFSGPALLEGLTRCGFVDVAPFEVAVPEHGIVWDEPWSWPVTARAPA